MRTRTDPGGGFAVETWAQIISAFPGRPADHPEKPLVPGGETWRANLTRTARAIDGILAATRAQTIIISGHAETVRAAWQHLSGETEAPALLPVKLAVDNASITRWATPAGQHTHWVLDSLSDIRHSAAVQLT